LPCSSAVELPLSIVIATTPAWYAQFRSWSDWRDGSARDPATVDGIAGFA
jgi:hypothetical protein